MAPSRFIAVLPGFLLGSSVGCSSSDADVILRDQIATEITAGPDAGPESMPEPDSEPEATGAACPPGSGLPRSRYQLQHRDSGLCLQRGAPTTVGVSQAWLVELAPCTEEEGALWQLIEDAGSTFQIRNIDTNYNLDVTMGNVFPGGGFVLFDPHARSNQLFLLTERLRDAFAITPLNSMLCVQSAMSGINLQWCSSTQTAQDWLVIAYFCTSAESSAGQ